MNSISLPREINFSIEKARKLQARLSQKLIFRDCFNKPIKYVAGVDIAYSGDQSIGAAAVLEYGSLKLIEVEAAEATTRFPYIPTLLSFREVPPAISAIRKLKMKPDVFLVDGHGFAHPYRLGFASHLGLVLNIATIGVAKNLLCGKIVESRNKVWKPIVHKGEIIGGAVYTNPNAKPIYVSVGHKVSLKTAIKIVLKCSKKHRIPEPIREAHATAEKIKLEKLKRITHKAINF